MVISEFEAQTAVWIKIEAELKERVEILRMKNDGDLDERKTSRIRGSIAAFSEILAWRTDSGPTAQ